MQDARQPNVVRPLFNPKMFSVFLAAMLVLTERVISHLPLDVLVEVDAKVVC